MQRSAEHCQNSGREDMALSNNHSSVIKGKQNDIPVSCCGSKRQGDRNRDAYVPCIVSLGPYHQAETRDDQNVQGCYSHVFQNKGYKNCMHSAILTDIMKLQNQVPLFILIKLLQLEFDDAKRELARILSNSNPFKGFPFNSKQESDDSIKSKLEKYIEENPCHLLDLYRMVIRDRLIPRSESSTAYRCGYQQLPSSNVGAQPHKDKSAEKEKLKRHIPCAEKLENAGIEIKSGNIKFQKSKFHQTYFSKPWYIVSLLAATALLVMTLIQTVYAVK
ncbi:hypothetical protein SUGI_0693600 [Cryptomeria japonica]|nr:hypothetical protein SUGI_0693600 [Cryptomeria japonica]